MHLLVVPSRLEQTGAEGSRGEQAGAVGSSREQAGAGHLVWSRPKFV